MNIGDLLLGLISLVLLVSGLAEVHLDDGREDHSFTHSYGVAVVGTLASLIITFLGFILYPAGYVYTQSLYVNPAGYWLSIGAEIATLIVLLGGRHTISQWRTRSSFLSLVLLALLGTVYLSFAANVIAIVASWALASAATYAISMIVKDTKSVEGGIKYMLMGIISSSIMIFGFSFYVVALGGFSLISPDPGPVNIVGPLPIAIIGITFLAVAFGFKIGAFPFHAWLPDVYAENDRIVVSFISSVGKVIGIAALLRVMEFVDFQGSMSQFIVALFAVLAIGSMFFGNFVAFSRKDLASIFAFSSVTQAGFLFIGFSMLGTSESSVAVAGIIVQTIAYVIAQAGLFLFVEYVEKNLGTVDLSSLNGLAPSNRWITTSVIILLLSLLGIPPLAGFWGKVFLFESSVYYPWLLILGVIASAISAAYYLGIVREMFKEGEFSAKGSFELDGVYVAAVLTVLIGILSPLIFNTIV